LLVGESKVNAKRRVDEALPLLLGDNVAGVVVQRLGVLGAQVDDFAVGRDARRSDGLGEDGVSASD
jgi:hypothetical protein